jgi:hypothetical protein
MNEKLTIKEKRKYLLEHGWYQAWNEDNWLSAEREYSNPDWQGLDTESAFEVEMEFGKKDPDTEKDFICGGKDITYTRLINKVKELQKQRNLKSEQKQKNG